MTIELLEDEEIQTESPHFCDHTFWRRWIPIAYRTEVDGRGHRFEHVMYERTCLLCDVKTNRAFDATFDPNLSEQEVTAKDIAVID